MIPFKLSSKCKTKIASFKSAITHYKVSDYATKLHNDIQKAQTIHEKNNFNYLDFQILNVTNTNSLYMSAAILCVNILTKPFSKPDTIHLHLKGWQVIQNSITEVSHSLRFCSQVKEEHSRASPLVSETYFFDSAANESPRCNLIHDQVSSASTAVTLHLQRPGNLILLQLEFISLYGMSSKNALRVS